jgi:hypothetical protein
MCWAAGWTSTEGFVDKITDGIPGPATLIGATREIDHLSCPTTTFCEGAAAVLTGPDSAREELFTIRKGKVGRLWPVAGAPGLDGLSCASATTCLAVGGTSNSNPFKEKALFVTVSNGKPGRPHIVAGTTGLGSSFADVSCLPDDSCVAVGNGVFGTKLVDKSFVVRITNGTAGAPVFGRDALLIAVSCYSATSCYAAGFASPEGEPGFGFVAQISGSTAGAELPVTGSTELLGISCTSQSTCQGSGEVEPNPSQPSESDAVVVTVAGGEVSAASTVSGAAVLQADSCPVGAPCASGGTTSQVLGQEGAVYTTALHPGTSRLTLTATPAHKVVMSSTVTFTLAVERRSGQPRATGTVTFTSGRLMLCAGVAVQAHRSGAGASCTVSGSTLGLGRHRVTASYSGDADYLPASKAIHYHVVMPG